jgi:hypothetical protein
VGHARRRALVKVALARLVGGLAFVAIGAMACRQGEPLDPKTPPNSPLPKIDRPSDPPASPSPRLPKPDRDGGAKLDLRGRGSALASAGE